MALIVQKYGGTSVGDVERIRNVARRALEARSKGHDVVVVVSAMAGETNRLLKLTSEIARQPSQREQDVVVSTGEQVWVNTSRVTHRPQPWDPAFVEAVRAREPAAEIA